MAGETTFFAHDDPRRQTLFVKDPFAYSLLENWFFQNDMVALSEEASGVVYMKNDLSNKVGDTMLFDLVNPLRGDGRGDRQRLQGYSERLFVDNFELIVHELGNSVEADSPLSEGRTRTKTTDIAERELMRWMSGKFETGCINAACGLYNWNTNIQIINEKEPSSNRIYYGGGPAAGGISTAVTQTDAALSAETPANYLMNTDVLRLMARKIELLEPGLIPIEREGQRVYPTLLHPLMVKALEACTDWKDIQKHANVRGSKNPFFTNSLGKIKNLQLYSYAQLPMRTGAGSTTPAEGFFLDTPRTATDDAVASGKTVAAGLILGQRAICVGIKQMPQYYVDSMDGFTKKGRKPRIPWIGFDSQVGISKSRFKEYDPDTGAETDREDYGTFTFHTQVVVD